MKPLSLYSRLQSLSGLFADLYICLQGSIKADLTAIRGREYGGEKVEELKPELQISLAAARVNANLSQSDVAAALKVSTNTVVNWEKYKTEMTLSQAKKIEELYKMPLKYIRT